MNNNLGWRSLPAILVATVPIYYSVYTLSKPVRTVTKFWYFFEPESLPEHFWSPLFLLFSGVAVIFTQQVRHSLSRRTLAVSGSVIISAELRYALSASEQATFFTLFVLFAPIFLSTVLYEASDSRSADTGGDQLHFRGNTTFGRVAVAACVLLVGVTVSIVVLVLTIETATFSPGTNASTPGIAFLIGGQEAQAETRIQFWAVAVAVVFVAVVTDATRHREIRWLTVLALVVNTGAVTFLWYPSLWTATVAAIGALLTVIVVALALDERTETAPT